MTKIIRPVFELMSKKTLVLTGYIYLFFDRYKYVVLFE